MIPRCFRCRWFIGEDRDAELVEDAPLVVYCKAFPLGGPGIPQEILNGEHDHETTPYPGDQGKRFEFGDS